VPVTVSFFLAEDFWPITSYPMFSRKQDVFYWPQVKYRSSESTPWINLEDDKCFGKIGSVRFQYALLNMVKTKNSQGIQDYSMALRSEFKEYCDDLRAVQFKISFYKYKIESHEIKQSFVQDLTGEIYIEK